MESVQFPSGLSRLAPNQGRVLIDLGPAARTKREKGAPVVVKLNLCNRRVFGVDTREERRQYRHGGG